MKSAEEREQQRKVKFHQEINESNDLSDNLQNLAQYLSHFTGATGVYIGRLLPPTRPVEDTSDDQAHILED